MRIGVVAETWPLERRVAATPDTVARLKKAGFSVVVAPGAGKGAGFADNAYDAEVGDPLTADIVLGVRPFSVETPARPGQVFIAHMWPSLRVGELAVWAEKGATVLAMDQVPRITRAQKLDALSSQANLMGYRAVVEAAGRLTRFFPGQVTAAGKVLPAKVLVIGAGVAGLAAIGAARGLGALVRAFDTRPVAREQVQSMGAEFLEVTIAEDGSGSGGYAKEMSPAFIEAEMALFLAQAKEVDVIITTALIPGRKAPVLLLAEAVRAMKPGSVVVDLAAEMGGNCEITRPGEAVVENGVSVLGFTDLPSRMAEQASQLYGVNLCHLLDDMGNAAGFKVDMNDEVVRPMTIVHGGAVTWPAPVLEAAPRGESTPAEPTKAPVPASPPKKKKKSSGHAPPVEPPSVAANLTLGALGVLVLLMGPLAPAGFLSHLLVFVLAVFIGWQVVWNVTPALHTPLMSVTNAISGIILVGGMVALRGQTEMFSATTVVSMLAILLAMINVGGGFLVTRRMLGMFRKEA